MTASRAAPLAASVAAPMADLVLAPMAVLGIQSFRNLVAAYWMILTRLLLGVRYVA